MDLSKIGKCELCVLAKQVRAKMIEIGEKAKTDGTWDQKLMDEYERCACDLECELDTIRRFESRKCRPLKSLSDIIDTGYFKDEQDREKIRNCGVEMLHEAFRLLSYEAPGNCQQTIDEIERRTRRK